MMALNVEYQQLVTSRGNQGGSFVNYIKHICLDSLN